MDSQALPVINSVAPALPHVAQPAPAPTAPPASSAPAAPVSSSSRSMVGQTNASFTTMLSRQATASTDSLINSPLDSPAPSTPAKAKRAAATTPAASAPTATATQAAPGTLKPAPSGKAEVAAAGIKRLDANMGAMASRVEDYISTNDDKISYVEAHLKKLADDVAGSALVNPPAAGLTASDIVAHPTVRALISANNSSVDIIDALRKDISSLQAEVTSLRSEGAKRKRDADDSPTHSDDVFLPAVKRVTPSTVVTANPLPAVALVASTYPTEAYSYDVPAAPPAAPAAGAAPPPAIAAHQNTAVDVGPIGWGKDISGQVRALIARLPRANTIDPEAVKSLHAKRFPKNNRFVTVFFPSNIAAIQFVNAWAAAPAPGFEKVSVSFGTGN
ncbi:hypothetical protein DFH09DRAFT_1381965 [Mycena vulgaris]|nr:hypothetical protein DFH09DRAFT_1381965 [Mycena vulgaris]